MAKRNKWVPEDEPEETQEINDISSAARTMLDSVREQTQIIESWQPSPDAPKYTILFPLPIGVLIALMEPEHKMADTVGAMHYGLLEVFGNRQLTAIGNAVLDGIVDKTQIRHKMAMAQRNEGK